MTSEVQEVLVRAMQLPHEDQAHVVNELLQNLQGSIDPVIEKAWDLETERRLNDVLAGRTPTIPLEVVLHRIESKFGK